MCCVNFLYGIKYKVTADYTEHIEFSVCWNL